MNTNWCRMRLFVGHTRRILVIRNSRLRRKNHRVCDTLQTYHGTQGILLLSTGAGRGIANQYCQGTDSRRGQRLRARCGGYQAGRR